MEEIPDFIETLILHSRIYWGMKVEDIAEKLCLNLEKTSKSYAATVIYRALELGNGGKYAEEFKKAGVNIKTVRCNPGLRPIYAMSLRGYKYEDIINEEWDSSKLKEDVEKMLLIVLTLPRRGAKLAEARLETVLYHTPNDADMRTMEEDWKDIIERIREGRANELGGRIGKIIQTRPKARDSNDKIPAPGGHMLVKKGFFIRPDYFHKILNIYIEDILDRVG